MSAMTNKMKYKKAVRYASFCMYNMMYEKLISTHKYQFSKNNLADKIDARTLDANKMLS